MAKKQLNINIQLYRHNPYWAWPKMSVLMPVQQALSYLLRVMPSEASPSHKKSLCIALRCHHGKFSIEANWVHSLGLKWTYLCRVKNMHINILRLGKSPGQLFRWFPFLVRFYLIFCSTCFLFFTTFLAVSVHFNANELAFFAKGCLKRVDTNLLWITIWGRVS